MQTIEALAYIVVESREPARWRQYAEQLLGMQALAAEGGGLHLKMDEREFRILVQPGAADRYLISGWQAVNEAAYRQALGALDRAGVALSLGSSALAQQRRVRELAAFTDPAGNRHELSWGYTGASSAFVSPIGVSGFKTGAFGLGHTVLPAIPFDETRRLFCEVLGMGVSDVFNFKPAPDAPNIRIHFLHGASGRHHSLALAEMPSASGCVHMMVEVASMTEVGLAHDRMQQQGAKLMATLGEHENDQMTSFYMMTPGNFAVEYGYGGLIVDPASWQTTQTQRVSIWGHDFSVGFR